MTRKNLEKKILQAVQFYLHPDDRKNVTLESTLSGELCFDSLDTTELAVSLEKEFNFKEKDAVWQDFFDGRNDPSVKELCDFVEKRL